MTTLTTPPSEPASPKPAPKTAARTSKQKRPIGCLGVVWRLALGVFVLALIVPLLRAGFECRVLGGGVAPELPPDPAPAAIQAEKDALPDYKRAEEQTFLTYPEWYIVYSADEYAKFIADKPPSQFPYFAAIGQYWQGYYNVCGITRGRYPYNDGYHLMLDVIGVSFTAEDAIKGVYENTIGRLTELISTPQLSEEDAFARTVAREYGAFTHHTPWFDFPFGEKLSTLWREVPLTGPNFIRKWERRVALSVEYGVKALYGGLIRAATAAAYGPEELRLQVWVKGITPQRLAEMPNVKLVKAFDGSMIVSIERYDPFTQAIADLAARGARFIELAGNDDVMLVAITSRDWAYDLPAGQALFEMPVLIDPTHKRIAIKVKVAQLHQVLADLDKRSFLVERIYDY